MSTARSTPDLIQELIFLDRDDDLASIKAKLESAGADQVYLAIPASASVLRTPLEFRILARMAHETSTETIIVTSDGDRRRMAHDEGFRTRRSLHSLGHMMRPAGRRGIWLPSLMPELPLPSFAALATALVLIGGLAILNIYILPVMTVRLTPNTETIRRDLNLTIDPGASQSDPQNGVVPGQRVEATFQMNGSAIVQGTKQLRKDKAHGEVVLTNRGASVTLPAGAVVLSKSGQRFTLDTATPLPAGARDVRAGITAADPGSAGNVGAGEINALDASIPKTVGVTNPLPTSGGTDREGKVVTEDDVAKLRGQLLTKAADQAARQLQANAGDGRTVPPNAVDVKVVSEQFEPGPGADADQLSGKMTLRAVGTAFANKDFDDVVTHMLLDDLRPDLEASPDGPRIGSPEVLGVDGPLIRLRVPATVLAVERIDTRAISTALSGRTVAQARTALQNVDGLAEPPEVDLWPAWANRAYRVQVEVVSPR